MRRRLVSRDSSSVAGRGLGTAQHGEESGVAGSMAVQAARSGTVRSCFSSSDH